MYHLLSTIGSHIKKTDYLISKVHNLSLNYIGEKPSLLILPHGISKDGSGNTRLIPQTIFETHLDYLRVRTELSPDRFEMLLHYIADPNEIGVIMEQPWSPGGNSIYYENTITSVLSIRGGFTYDAEKNKTSVMLDFSGEYFASKNNEDTWRLLRGLYHAYKCTCSRIDLAIDDYSMDAIPIDEMWKSTEQGNNFGFRNFKHVYGGKALDKKQKEARDKLVHDGIIPIPQFENHTIEPTWYFGSRNSGKMIRVYVHEDLTYDDNGKPVLEKVLRYETEFKRAYSHVVFLILISMEDAKEELLKESVRANMSKDKTEEKKANKNLDVFIEVKNWLEKFYEGLHLCDETREQKLSKLIGALAVSAIDFRDKSVRKDRSKASLKDTPRLSFWQNFIDKIGISIKIKTPQIKSSVQRTVAWMQRQVSKKMSVFRDGLGAVAFTSFMKELIDGGRNRQTGIDLKLTRYIKNNPQLISSFRNVSTA